MLLRRLWLHFLAAECADGSRLARPLAVSECFVAELAVLAVAASEAVVAVAVEFATVPLCSAPTCPPQVKVILMPALGLLSYL